MTSENTEDILLHLPEGIAYTCHNEGVCCNVFDTIPLDSEAERSLDNLDATALNAAAGNENGSPVSVENPVGPPPRKVARKACGSCAMLTDGNLCAIHSMAGEMAKPQVCRDFPWRFVETPDGVYVGLSFVCPSVRKNRGQMVTEQKTTLITRYQNTKSVRKTPHIIPLNARVNLAWNQYLQVESLLAEIISVRTIPLPNRLIALCFVPTFIDQTLAQSAGNDPVPPIPHDQLFGPVCDAIRANDYRHIRRLAGKSTAPAVRSRRMFLGMFTSFANTLHNRDKGRVATVAGVMSQYVRHASGMGAVTLQPIDQKMSHAILDKAVIPDDGYAAEQIERYVAHCVYRKDLALTGDLTGRVRLLVLNAALIPWYAAALATEHGRPAPTDADWSEAIGHVERLYGFHSAFYRFFERNKVFSDIVDSFILKPSYPFTLLR